jgi:hypothetical protein
MQPNRHPSRVRGAFHGTRSRAAERMLDWRNQKAGKELWNDP